jgi:hypothetical protein
MKPFAKLGYLAAACTLLVATFAMIGPRAVRAAVATLVQVSNTTADPIPNSSVDEPARHVWTASCTEASATNFLFCTTPPTPANEEVVVQAETYSFLGSPTNTFASLGTSTVGNTSTFGSAGQSADNGNHQPNNSDYFYTSSTIIYVDPGSYLSCSVTTKGQNPTGGGLQGTCSYSGYYVTLP